MQAWLEASCCDFGPVFRRADMWGGIDDHALNAEAVAQILKRRAERAGLTVELGQRLSPHGLRAGAIPQAVVNGVTDAAIKEHARHKDVRSTYGYIRRGKLLTESPAKKLGL